MSSIPRRRPSHCSLDSMRDIFLEVLLPRVFDLHQDGEILFSEIRALLPEHFPDRLGSAEPLKRIEPEHVAEVLGYCQRQGQKSVDWKRANRSLGRIFIGRSGIKPLHASIKMVFPRKKSDPTSLVALFDRLCKLFAPDFACLHYMAEADVQTARENGTGNFLDVARTKFNFNVTTHQLIKYLPDLYWATVLGAPYTELLGIDNVVTAPVHRVEALGPSAVYLQLTGSLDDLQDNFDGAQAIRQAAKLHLNTNAKCCAFFDSSLGVDYPYCIPSFFEGQYALGRVVPNALH